IEKNTYFLKREAGPLLATLPFAKFTAKGRPVVSVTSDVTASANYHAAPPKPALPDPSQLSSSFAAMVDSNLPNDPPSHQPAAPPPHTAPPQPRQLPTAEQPPPRDPPKPRQPGSAPEPRR